MRRAISGFLADVDPETGYLDRPVTAWPWPASARRWACSSAGSPEG